MSWLHVKIYHGPTGFLGSPIHRPQKLKGLRDQLFKNGYRVDLVPVEWVNYCRIVMGSYVVFSCNLKYLGFNTHIARDPVAQAGFNAVMDATEMFLRARNFLWVKMQIENNLFTRSEYAPKEYWPFDVEFEPLQSNDLCLKCCGKVSQEQDLADIHCHHGLENSTREDDNLLKIYGKPADLDPNNK